jgi:hypothetical protein
MSFYVRDWGRPMGVEPKIFTDLNKAEANSEFAQFVPSIEEFKTEFEARRFIRRNSDEVIEVVK